MLEFKNVSLKLNKKYYSLFELNFSSEKNLIFFGKKEDGVQHILRLIAKIQRGYEGEILLENMNIETTNFKTNISLKYLPEKPVFFENKSVYKNLIYPLKIRKIDKKIIKEKMDEFANKYELNNILNIKINKLSYEEKWLVALCRAVICPANYYLFDFFDFGLLKINNNLKKIFFDIVSLPAKFYFSTENNDFNNYINDFQIIKIVNGQSQNNDFNNYINDFQIIKIVNGQSQNNENFTIIRQQKKRLIHKRFFYLLLFNNHHALNCPLLF